ncbi:MAG TPA: serine hydrolase [Bacteroidales bacterium]|nr:serine hydrolase [Bacteroidales bacterium]
MKIEQAWLQQTIEELVERFNIPSMEVAIVQQGEVSFAGSGVREVEKQELADKDSLYSIASITKTFVAAAASLLVEEGLLSWDAPVVNYLPNFQMYNDALTQGVTLRDLLCHRTGVPRHDRSWFFHRDKLQQADVLNNIRYLEPSQPLRYVAQYNNYMFALASYIIEHATGKPWDEFVAERLLKPLGMNNTFFRKEDILGQKNRAIGYQTTSEKHVPVPYGDIYFMGGAGCVSSSASDMIKWVQFHLNGGRVGDQQLIPSKMVKELLTPIVANEVLPWNHFPEFTDQSYGICWLIEYYRGHKIVSKDGGVDGYLSDLVLIPELDFGIISLTNRINHTTIQMLQNMIFDKLFGFSAGNWADRYEKESSRLEDLAKQNFAKEKARVGQHTLTRHLQDYVGTYTHPAYGDYVISQNVEQLMISYFGRQVAVDHVVADHFMLIMDSSNQAIPLQFQASLDGRIHGVSIILEPQIPTGIYFKKQA